MEAVVDNHDHQNDLFTDSDTDYANVDEVNVKKKKRKVLASPRVSKQLKKSRSEGSTGDIEFKSSPAKTPRSLKQQLSFNVSPRKSPAKSLHNNHVPLTTENRKVT